MLLVLLVAAGAAFAAYSLLGSGGTEGDITECSIAEDGTLTARGWVDGDSGSLQLEVAFEDAATGAEVDADSLTVQATDGSRTSWDATGSAGDDVQRVTCVLRTP